MDNFFEFIEEDIEAKKNMLSTMPINNKTNKGKYNDALEKVLKKYQGYKEGVEKYILAKSESFEVEDTKKDNSALDNKVKRLLKVTKMLNPLNSYVEKLELDSLLFDLQHSSSFAFDKLNGKINKIIDKFELAGIELSEDDFKATFYVHEYMRVFFKSRTSKNIDNEKLSEVFEKIYWFNPELMEHIELNFRQLMKKHAKKFESFIAKEQERLCDKYEVKDYKDAKLSYKEKYNDLKEAEKETIFDIVSLAKEGQIEIKNYFEDSKFRSQAYESLMINKVETDADKEKFYESIEKLKSNSIEFKNYLEYNPLFEKFVVHFPLENKEENKIKTIESEIDKLEDKLEKLNKKIFKKVGGTSFRIVGLGSKENLKELKIQSIKVAKELKLQYISLEEERVRTTIVPLINNSMLISDVMNVLDSFNAYRRKTIKEVADVQNYNELLEYELELTAFIDEPNNIIVNGIYAYEEEDVPTTIVNKYKFENVGVGVEELGKETIGSLINKIDFLLRINTINNSKLTVDKIWFMVQTSKMLGEKQ